MNKILIIIFCIFFITSCKNKAQEILKKDTKEKQVEISESHNKKAVIKAPKSIITDDLLNCFIKEKEVKHVEGEDLFVYKDFSLELTNCEMAICDLNYKDKNINVFYHLTDDFDAGELNIWIYKLNNQHIYLLELDDYYASIFYMYIFTDSVLTRLGKISIRQPNVEEEGIKKESFKICKENDVILMECFLDNKLYSTHKLEMDKSKIIKKSKK